MTTAALAEILESTGFPVVYLAYTKTEVPEMPFITFYDTGTDNFAADGKVYHVITDYEVTLWHPWPPHEGDPDGEALIETALQNAGLYWNKSTEADDDESCLQTTYILEV